MRMFCDAVNSNSGYSAYSKTHFLAGHWTEIVSEGRNIYGEGTNPPHPPLPSIQSENLSALPLVARYGSMIIAKMVCYVPLVCRLTLESL